MIGFIIGLAIGLGAGIGISALAIVSGEEFDKNGDAAPPPKR